ncbi:MAG: adenosylmethionine decarboxylase [Nitrospiraceae bacterium]|nr:MAG: adenosylmethionine decarboxylase [Nitrospiraceae bacterium]
MKPLGRQLVAEFTYCSEDILSDRNALECALKEGILESGLTLVSITGKQFAPAGVTAIALISESHIAIHTYPEAGHASIDIFTCASGSQSVNRLLEFLKDRFRPRTVKVMEIHRGNPLELRQKNWLTGFSGTGFEIKYYIDEVLLSTRTQYQQIDIIANENFGRMMFLDRDLQIAEKDAHIYNEAMVAPFIENQLRRFGKVAVLGGGDGGVLREALRHGPERVDLIEIDREVIDAARAYLPRVCEDAFDSETSRIIIEDAMAYLEGGHAYDAIIYDLTMHPESITNVDRTEFLRAMFSRMQNNTAPGGMVSMQCCSEYDEETVDLLNVLLPKHFTNIEYRKSFIPSFCENWIFASAKVR